MIKIAVFDDEIDQLEYIYQIVHQSLENRHIDHCVEKYNDLMYFKDSIKNKTLDYDVLFWDIQTEDGHSLQVASDIYAYNPNIKMVYVTSYEHYFKDIFNSNVLYFVDKKDLNYKIDDIIDKILNMYRCQKISIKNKNSIQMIDMSQVMYIERKLRMTHVKTIDDKIYTSHMKLDEILSQLNYQFVRTHNSFVVSMKYISKITRTSILLIDGTIIPVSRQYSKLLKEKIF